MRRHQATIVMLVLGGLLPAFAAAGDVDKPLHLTFIRDSAPIAATGHVVLELDPKRRVPDDWRMYWRFVLRSPEGLTLPIGELEDTPGSAPRIVLQLPAGSYRLAMAKEAGSRFELEAGLRGVFNLTTMTWDPPAKKKETLFNATVVVAKGRVRRLVVKYANAVVAQPEGRKGQVLLAQNIRLEQREGRATDVPAGAPETYPLVKYGTFGQLKQADLIRAAESDPGLVEAVMEDIADLDRIAWRSFLPGEAKKLEWSNARILAHVIDGSMVEPLSRTLSTPLAEEDLPTIWLLGASRQTSAVPALVHALKEGSPEMRLHALFSLARVGDGGALPALLTALSDRTCLYDKLYVTQATLGLRKVYTVSSSKKMVTYEPLPFSCINEGAIYALGQLVDPRATERLLALLWDQEESIRGEAIKALAHHSEKRVVKALMEKLRGERSANVVLAISSLANMRATEAAESLRALARESGDATVRKFASSALGTLVAGQQDRDGRP